MNFYLRVERNMKVICGIFLAVVPLGANPCYPNINNWLLLCGLVPCLIGLHRGIKAIS